MEIKDFEFLDKMNKKYHKGGKRRSLCLSSLEEEDKRFLRLNAGPAASNKKKMQMLTSVESSIILEDNESVKGLRYAVVVAHIFKSGYEPVSLAYAPVNF